LSLDWVFFGSLMAIVSNSEVTFVSDLAEVSWNNKPFSSA
jgi:hypothetical protein